jgi:hypothetical protein
LNSKIALIIFSFVIAGCGVKSAPRSKKENAIPSVEDTYKKKILKKSSAT